MLLFLFLFSISKSYGWEDIKTRITVTTSNGYSSDKLIFGLNSAATNSLDTSLGELESPPLGPPNGLGINPVFYIYDSAQKAYIYTWMDLRPYPESDTSTVVYIIEIFKAVSDTITFSWKPLWPEIDKAVLIDNPFNGTIVNINMKDSTQATISNNFIHNFKLLVHYKNTTSVGNVGNNENNDNLKIYPQIFSDKIIVESQGIYSDYKILNLVGQPIIQGEIADKITEINTELLQVGVYFIICNSKDGKSKILKLLKY